MGKRKGGTGLIRLLLLFALLTLVGYNTFEISRLRTEIAALRKPTLVTKENAPSAAAVSAPATEIQRHAERAQEFFRRKEYAAASREMASAATAARRAGGEVSDDSKRALTGLRNSARSLADRAGALLSAPTTRGGDGSVTEKAKQ